MGPCRAAGEWPSTCRLSRRLLKVAARATRLAAAAKASATALRDRMLQKSPPADAEKISMRPVRARGRTPSTLLYTYQRILNAYA